MVSPCWQWSTENGFEVEIVGNPHPKAIEICEKAMPWRTNSAVNGHSHPTSPAELQLQAASVGHVHGSRSCDVFLTMSFHLAFSFQIPPQDPRFMSQNVQNVSIKRINDWKRRHPTSPFQVRHAERLSSFRWLYFAGRSS